MSSAFIRSTIEVRHSSFSCLAATALSRIGATSTLCAGAADGAADAVAPPPEAAPPAGVAEAEWPKIAPIIFPKMLISLLPSGLRDGVLRDVLTALGGFWLPGGAGRDRYFSSLAVTLRLANATLETGLAA